MNEEQLELLWIDCLELKCPLAKKKLNRIKSFAIKGIEKIPPKFSEAGEIVEKFISYCLSRNLEKINFQAEDLEVYLAWKIWQEKAKNIDYLIVNKIAKTKAKLIFSNSLIEFHKTASRIKREAQRFQDIFATLDLADSQLLATCQQILDSVSTQEKVAIETYQKILDNHNQAVTGISKLIKQEIKASKLRG